jgi:anti-sigma factor RsiW
VARPALTGWAALWPAQPEQRQRWWLWGALGAAVLVLGGMAWSLTREMRQP